MASTKHVYNMRHGQRGLAYIINNVKFDNLTERTGSDLDEERLTERFSALQFTVKTFRNRKSTQMVDLLDRASREDHSDRDCFVCVILSHGEEDRIYGTDGPVEVTKLLDPFKGHRCGSLAGKPKLFFIQACRGTEPDYGADVLSVKGDGDNEDVDDDVLIYRIPREADFLVAYSTVNGFKSWRNTRKGSWFILALCKVLEEHGTTLDLMTMMTRVNHIVAHDYSAKDLATTKKQIPCITSMLTKDLFFHPK
ncbi:caspase-3-like [Haliotis cracherodii]|uniref:caspase-3-like n=1 Tax=Haliotis cracherodii TaxID=6455 RepID=UPI0039EC7EE0